MNWRETKESVFGNWEPPKKYDTTKEADYDIMSEIYKRMIELPDDVAEADELVPETREDRMFESFAKEAMRELVKAGIADFVLLKNDKLRSWWQKVVKEELAEQARREAREHKRMLKEQALAKLSDEEKEALGLTRKKK